MQYILTVTNVGPAILDGYTIALSGQSWPTSAPSSLDLQLIYSGTPITVSDVGTLAQSRVGFASWGGWVEAGLDRQWGSILSRCRRSRGFGDFWGHMLVARGAAEAMAEPDLQSWDVAALSVIVAEAGGRLTDFSGAPFRGRGSCLTTNGLVHDEILAELGAG